jgi:adenylate cyclase
VSAGSVTAPSGRIQGDAISAWLLGDGEQSTARLRVRVQAVLTTVLVVANVIGAVVVALLALFILPGPSVFTGRAFIVTFAVLPTYVLLALVAGVVFGTRRAFGRLVWLREDRSPSADEASAALGIPLQLVRLQALLWGIATVLFTALYGRAAADNVPRALFAVLFGGIVVCANAYLLAEFALRPVAARALLRQSPSLRAGVRVRILLAWVCGSGLPVLGLMLVAVFALVRETITVTRLAGTVLALCVVTLVFGLLLLELVNRATIAPIRAVHSAMAQVREGEFDVSVAVNDGTELGQLQAGFNDMAMGLREREQVRDLFGRHVGQAVAAKALASEPELGGEERFVAVVFVDLVGSTELAFTQAPADVVQLLNRFFTVVVEEVEVAGGLINKFIGDAALAIFGAPTPLADACGNALRAATALQERLGREVPECAIGAGVAAGVAIAGNVGTRERFEYTVIGDPVNEAARLADLAKDGPGLVASGKVVEAADRSVALDWRFREEVTLRGRQDVTRVHVPAGRSVRRGA